MLTRATSGIEQDEPARTIQRRRSLPGGRAVVGAFLVIVATVGTFGAYLSATAAPSTSYVVAARAFEVGEVVMQEDLVGDGAGVRPVALELPPEVAGRALPADDGAVDRLVGQLVVAPLAAGDLLLASHFADVATADRGVVLSLSLPAERALAGRVAAGERIDLVATFTAAGARGSETRIVARDIGIVAVNAAGDGLSGGRVTLLVEVDDLATAQAVQHAVDTAEIAVLRGADPTVPSPPATTAASSDTAAATPEAG
jgi:hypothetical protein